MEDVYYILATVAGMFLLMPIIIYFMYDYCHWVWDKIEGGKKKNHDRF